MAEKVKTVVQAGAQTQTTPQAKPVASPQQASVVKPLVNKLPGSSHKTKAIAVTAVITILVLVAGVGSGWFLSGNTLANLKPGGGSQSAAPGAKESLTEAGLEDEDSFPDTAEGVLKEGGIQGEGTHHLEREGGESKYVYLTSTVIDLSSFKDKNVEVFGETLSALKAPWLMDVGRIKVTE